MLGTFIIALSSSLDPSAITRRELKRKSYTSIYKYDASPERDIFNLTSNCYNYTDNGILSSNKPFEGHFYDLFNTKLISENVLQNVIKIFKSIAISNLTMLSIDDIYATDYKTIVAEFIFRKDCYFSLEIGKDDIGFFSKINNKTFDYCESYNKDPLYNTKSINEIIFSFSEKVNNG